MNIRGNFPINPLTTSSSHHNSSLLTDIIYTETDLYIMLCVSYNLRSAIFSPSEKIRFQRSVMCSVHGHAITIARTIHSGSKSARTIYLKSLRRSSPRRLGAPTCYIKCNVSDEGCSPRPTSQATLVAREPVPTGARTCNSHAVVKRRHPLV